MEVIILVPWIVTRDSSLISYKSNLQPADFLCCLLDIRRLTSKAGFCRLWVSVLFLYMALPFSVCIISFSVP